MRKNLRGRKATAIALASVMAMSLAGFDYWTAYGTYDYHLKPMYWDTDAPRDSFYYVNQWARCQIPKYPSY